MIYTMSPRHVSFLKKQELCFISEEILQSLICAYTAFLRLLTLMAPNLYIYIKYLKAKVCNSMWEKTIILVQKVM